MEITVLWRNDIVSMAAVRGGDERLAEAYRKLFQLMKVKENACRNDLLKVVLRYLEPKQVSYVDG